MILRPFSRFTKSTPGLILFIAAFLFPHHLLLPNNALAQSSLSLIELGSFKFKRQRIEDQKGDFEDRLDLRGTFTLGAGSDGIDPVTEAVEVTIEGVDGSTVFTQTIPLGSFKQKKDKPGEREFEFKAKGKGKKRKGKLEKIKIKEKGAGRFEFEIKGTKLQFECCLSTTIIFTIGDDVGAFDTDANAQIPLDTTPPVVTITEPSDGDTVATDSLLVRGTVDAGGAEVGVTVNGVVAEVSQGEFAAFVPLQLGTNTITATVVDPTGSSASDSVTVDVSDLREEPLRLLASPSSGLNPLFVELRALSLLERAIVLFELDFEGDGVVDLSSATFDSVSHTYTEEGLFFPTLTVTDDLGNKTSATTIVNVFPLPDLVAKWDDMKDALRIGDIDGALSFIAEESRERYQEIFTVLSSQLFQIDSFLTDINLLMVEGNQAEFEMLRISEGAEVSFYVLFVRDSDGIWRLRTF